MDVKLYSDASENNKMQTPPYIYISCTILLGVNSGWKVNVEITPHEYRIRKKEALSHKRLLEFMASTKYRICHSLNFFKKDNKNHQFKANENRQTNKNRNVNLGTVLKMVINTKHSLKHCC